uniref:Uncharacterized protein n=1 Tax=Graphocephala atropunctata TaxID=36148 RepID=A0A1B6KJG3_9HEMI
MMEAELSTKPDCWQSEKLELISEVSRPSLCSLSTSECSDTTVDLDGLECSDSNLKRGPTPLENNFVNETCQSMYEITNQNGTSVTDESANNMNRSLNVKVRKCFSLHDVSNILPLPLAMKSANTVSSETVHSQSLSSTTKSKDSGFQRSVSFVSLTSGRKNYDHVQSKVKAYIMNIKESEAIRKRNKQLAQTVEVVSEPVSLVDEIDLVLDKEDLLLKIQELKHELQEKAIYIDAQQRNYNNLLLKLAEAKNTIDSLRLQRISLNYSSSLNNSQNLSSQFQSIDFEFLEKEINKRINQTGLNKNSITDMSVGGKVTPIKEERSLSIDTSTCSLTEVFTPKNHSTPNLNEAKSLSPVSKMFSSSSRLDKNYKPLENLKKQINNSNSGTSHQPFNNWKPQSQLESCPCLPRKLKISASDGTSAKLNSSGVKSNGCPKTNTSHIDLPNDNPYDKVKKWQASLPNINLLRTRSSSEGEGEGEVEAGREGDVEIGTLLSQELVSKCNISHSAHSLHIHQPPLQDVGSNKLSMLHSFTNNLSNSTAETQTGRNESQKLNKEQNQTIRVQSGKISFSEGRSKNSKALFQNQSLVFPAPIAFQDSSVSESESHLPKSFTLTSKLNRVVNDDSDEDSSSISSSVLGSTAPSSPVKRKSGVGEPKIWNKVPKLVGHSSVVLRKPRLNVTLDCIPKTTKAKFSHKCSTNSNNSPNTIAHHIAESSERKAWNNRNNANFFVCKDFCFKKSSSLEDCLNLMEGMVQTGTSIIESALDRSHC